MMTPHQQHAYRKTLAWIGFITLYIAVPILAVLAIRYVATLGIIIYDRDMFCATHREVCDPFYQQTKNSITITDINPLLISEVGILHDPEIKYSHI